MAPEGTAVVKRAGARGRRRDLAIRIAGVAGVLALSAALALTRPFTLTAGLVTVAAFVPVVLRGWKTAAARHAESGRAPRHRGPTIRSLAGWIAAVSLVVAYELWMLLSHPRAAYPTVSSLYDEISAHAAPKAVVALAWLALGLALASW